MHGFPSTLQNLRGLFKKKKRHVAGNEKYSVVSRSKRGRKRGGYPIRGYPKVNPAKQFAAKNSAYNFSSRFQRELISHSRRDAEYFAPANINAYAEIYAY